ncbi:hypothetical protein [Amycolatopsis cihanbeyliensis]|nr:hypothetical protein [Amycolatopsis cihanbeyliensis]
MISPFRSARAGIFSFAGEHRSYVEHTKLACERLGMLVFYDRDRT